MVGVDLGGTKILVGVVDSQNKIHAWAKKSTPSEAGGPTPGPDRAKGGGDR